MTTSMLLRLGMIALTVVVYLAMVATNEWLFTDFELTDGAFWIYLPAGVRLIFTLMFGGIGALGIFIAALIATRIYYFPYDFISSIADATACAIGPYIIYRFMAYRFNLRNGCLQNLTPSMLLGCSVAFAFANSVLQHSWLIPMGYTVQPYNSLIVMFIGDLLGTLIVLYTIKVLLHWFSKPSVQP